MLGHACWRRRRRGIIAGAREARHRRRRRRRRRPRRRRPAARLRTVWAEIRRRVRLHVVGKLIETPLSLLGIDSQAVASYGRLVSHTSIVTMGRAY